MRIHEKSDVKHMEISCANPSDMFNSIKTTITAPHPALRFALARSLQNGNWCISQYFSNRKKTVTRIGIYYDSMHSLSYKDYGVFDASVEMLSSSTVSDEA